MGLGIARRLLMSRTVRSAVTAATGGTRVINALNTTITATGANGVIKHIFNATKMVGGFLWGVVKNTIGVAAFTFTALWSTIVSVTMFVYNFNWNITDKALDQLVNSQYVSLYGIAGGLVGNTLGYLACGILPASTLFVFNELAGAYVLKEVAQQMGEDFLGHLTNLVSASFRTVAIHAFAETYKNFRKFMKRKGSLARRIFGNKRIDDWGKEGQPNVSFSEQVDNWVTNIKDDKKRSFISEMLDEMGDACIEAGYVVAGALDTYISNRNIGQTHILGNQRVVQVTPNRSTPDEITTLSGRTQNLQPAIMQTITQHQVLGNRDIGMLVGTELNEALRGKMPTVRLILTYYNRRLPPYQIKRKGVINKRVVYNIPDVKRSKLDWETIKRAMGGQNGYLWGRWRCTANLDNNRQMAVYGSTKDNAEDRLLALASLCDANIVTMSTTEELNVGRRAKGQPMQKEITRVYPAFFTIVNNTKVPAASGGVATLSGNKKVSKAKIELWHNTKPPDTDQRILNVLNIQKPPATP